MQERSWRELFDEWAQLPPMERTGQQSELTARWERAWEQGSVVTKCKVLAFVAYTALANGRDLLYASLLESSADLRDGSIEAYAIIANMNLWTIEPREEAMIRAYFDSFESRRRWFAFNTLTRIGSLDRADLKSISESDPNSDIRDDAKQILEDQARHGDDADSAF